MVVVPFKRVDGGCRGEVKTKEKGVVFSNGYKGESETGDGKSQGEAKIAGRKDAGRDEVAKYRQSRDAETKKLVVCGVGGRLSWPAGEVDVVLAGRGRKELEVMGSQVRGFAVLRGEFGTDTDLTARGGRTRLRRGSDAKCKPEADTSVEGRRESQIEQQQWECETFPFAVS